MPPIQHQRFTLHKIVTVLCYNVRHLWSTDVTTPCLKFLKKFHKYCFPLQLLYIIYEAAGVA